jgi:hypothetical protein
MFILSMATASARHLPSIPGEKLNQLSDLHTPLGITLVAV